MSVVRVGGLRILFLCAASLFAASQSPATTQIWSAALDTPSHFKEEVGPLSEVLTHIAKSCDLPIFVEIARPMPELVRVPEGNFTVRELLNLIVQGNPSYAWQNRGRVVHFYEKELATSPKNFLNWKLDQVTISGSVADVELRLRARVNKMQAGVAGEGGLGVGLRSTALSAHSLPTFTMRETTAREVLIRVAEIDGRFFSVIVFPRKDPQTRKDIEAALADWKWKAFLPKETR